MGNWNVTAGTLGDAPGNTPATTHDIPSLAGARTVTTTLEAVAAWVEAAIAPLIESFIPPADGAVDDITLETGHPTVYPLFVPAAERLSEGERQAPSIAVQLLPSSDSSDGMRTLNIRLMLTVWAPGHFADGVYLRDYDGWRDLLNGIDAMVTAVEAADVIAGCHIDRGEGVRYGLADFDGEIPDLYPFWMGRVDFTLNCGVPAKTRFEKIL